MGEKPQMRHSPRSAQAFPRRVSNALSGQEAPGLGVLVSIAAVLGHDNIGFPAASNLL